jgi:hydrogenase maturation protease
MKILVLALGNEIRGDDAAALHTAEILKRLFANTDLVDVVPTPRSGVALIDYLTDDYDYIYILDTVIGDKTGIIVRVEVGEYQMPQLPPHHMGLPDVISLLKSLGHLSSKINIYCIQVKAENVKLKIGLSPEAKEAAEKLAKRVYSEIRQLLSNRRKI